MKNDSYVPYRAPRALSFACLSYNFDVITVLQQEQIHSICSLRTEKHKALLKDEEWAKLPPKVQESPYFADGKLLFDAERLGILLEKNQWFKMKLLTPQLEFLSGSC